MPIPKFSSDNWLKSVFFPISKLTLIRLTHGIRLEAIHSHSTDSFILGCSVACTVHQQMEENKGLSFIPWVPKWAEGDKKKTNPTREKVYRRRRAVSVCLLYTRRRAEKKEKNKMKNRDEAGKRLSMSMTWAVQLRGGRLCAAFANGPTTVSFTQRSTENCSRHCLSACVRLWILHGPWQQT